MKIIEQCALDSTLVEQLNTLIQKCDDYEPYFLCDTDFSTDLVDQPVFMHYIAFSDEACTNMVGFLSFVITKDRDFPEAEITALVEPEWRRHGVCRQLLIGASKYLEANNITYRTCQLPEHLSRSSINKGTAYSEYLLQLEKADYQSKIDGLLKATSSSSDKGTFEYYFSDDDCEYLMYHDESADEPIAVCYLDYQPSFTNLYNVYVDEDLRKNGIGTSLITNLLSDYFEESDLPLILNVKSTNPAALRLYKKCGFVEINRLNYYTI